MSLQETEASSSEVKYNEAWLQGYDGHNFYTRTYPATPAARGAIVFVHGYAEHIQRYEHVHSAWAARGFSVLAFDQRGYGRTALDKEHRSKDAGWTKTSAKEQIKDIAWFLKTFREKTGSVPLFLVGQSMVRARCLHLHPSAARVHECCDHFIGRRTRSPVRSAWRPRGCQAPLRGHLLQPIPRPHSPAT